MFQFPANCSIKGGQQFQTHNEACFEYWFLGAERFPTVMAYHKQFHSSYTDISS